MPLKRQRDGEPLEESRVFRKNSLLLVYVPPKPRPRPDDCKLDFPPGDPPEVHYDGVRESYGLVLRTGQMLYMGGTKRFSNEEMDWLNGLSEQVEALIYKS